MRSISIGPVPAEGAAADSPNAPSVAPSSPNPTPPGPAAIDSWAGAAAVPPATTSIAPTTAPFSFAQALSRLRARLGARIREVNKLSESEILSVGNGVHRIVTNATGHIENSKNEMLSLVEAIRAGLPACSPPGTSCGFDASSREPPNRLMDEAMAQADLAGLGTAIASRVRAAARNLDALTSELASVLAPAPEAGRPSSDELQRLLAALAASATDVQAGADQLSGLLPELSAKAEQIRLDASACAAAITERCDQADACLLHLGEALETISRTSNDEVEAILRASRDALSHLQFQDVVAQGIMQLDSWIRDLEIEATAAEGKPSENIAPPMQPPVGEADLEAELLRDRAGDILLL
jgi:hypothetical protein